MAAFLVFTPIDIAIYACPGEHVGATGAYRCVCGAPKVAGSFSEDWPCACSFAIEHQQEGTMPGNKGGGHVKNRKKYEALKRKGMSKTRAAKIANSGKEGSRKGGKNSHS